MKQPFDYFDCSLPIREDLVRANRRAWSRIGEPGTWWDGRERVAIAAEVRAAADCGFCRERKAALSPNAVDGEHDSPGDLPEAAVDTVHRLVNDQSRLSEQWLAGVAAAGVSAEQYVELLGVTVTTVSVDQFHHALGLPLEPLPEPSPGPPSRYRPPGLVEGEAWVPMIAQRRAGKDERDLFPVPQTPYVLRALSSVPEEVRCLAETSEAYYLPPLMTADAAADGGRSISRAQMELVAARVSLLNECFY